MIIIHSLHLYQNTFSCLQFLLWLVVFFSLKERSNEKAPFFLRLQPMTAKTLFLKKYRHGLEVLLEGHSVYSWSRGPFWISLLVEPSVVKGVHPTHLPTTQIKWNNFLNSLPISKGTINAKNSITAFHMSCISASLRLIIYPAEVLKFRALQLQPHHPDNKEWGASWCYQGCTAIGRCLFVLIEKGYNDYRLLNRGGKELKSEWEQACPLFYYMFGKHLKLFPLEVI